MERLRYPGSGLSVASSCFEICIDVCEFCHKSEKICSNMQTPQEISKQIDATRTGKLEPGYINLSAIYIGRDASRSSPYHNHFHMTNILLDNKV
jgi:hypothetical protein